MFRPKKLHEVLVLTHEQSNLDALQGYLQDSQSIFKDVSRQLVIVGKIVCPGCMAPGLFSTSPLQSYGGEVTAEVAV